MADITEKSLVYKVSVDTSDLDRSAVAAAEKVQRLKDEQKKLDQSTEDGRIAYQKYNAAIKEAQAEQRKLTDLQRAAIREQNALEGSNNKLRAQLTLLTAQYNKLSEEQRESTDSGKELGNQIAAISAKLKENESAVGDNRRNVGGYEEAVISASEKLKVNTTYVDTNTKANLGLQGQMEKSARSTAAIAGSFGLLSQVVGDNEAAQDALRKITLAVTAATVLSNLAKEKGAILDTIAFVKTKALAGAQVVYNAAVGAGTKALKIFRAALAATGIGAVIVAVGFLIDKMMGLQSATESAADAQERYNKELERERAIIEEVQKFRDELSDGQFREIERAIKLREAQGASEKELLSLEIDLLRQKLERTKEIQRETATAAGQSDRYAAALENEKDLILELTLAQIEYGKIISAQKAEQESFNATLNEQGVAVETISTNYKEVFDIISKLKDESYPELKKISQETIEQNERNQQAIADEMEAQRQRFEMLAATTQDYATQIGQIFADSITEAGFEVEDFYKKLATLTIDILQRQLLSAIAQIYFNELASKGLAGIATGAALTALVVGFSETAKAALTKPVKFEYGGELDSFTVGGKAHSQGGTKYYGEDGNVIEMEKDERVFVVNKKAARSGLLEQLAIINMAHGGRGLNGSSNYLADGGFATRGISNSINSEVRTAQLAAEIVRNLPSFQVSVSEINRVQNGVNVVQSVATL